MKSQMPIEQPPKQMSPAGQPGVADVRQGRLTRSPLKPPQAAIPSGTLHPYRGWTPYAFLLPACFILGMFVIAAMVQVLIYSFTRYTAFRGPDFIGWDNYRRVFGSALFWASVGNSFFYLLVTPVIMALSLGAAMVVHAALRFTKGLRALLFLPVVTPTIVAAIAFRLVFNEDDGLLNSLLSRTPVGAVRWLSEYPYTLISAMIVTLWKGFGYYMMIFLAGLMGVPRELEEAATIDGAGRFGVFWNVTLPAIRPVLVLVALISSISALKVFDEIFITVHGAPEDHKTVVPLIYNTAFENGDYGYASAIGIVLFAIILVFSLVNLRVTGGGK
jgi:putative chitobiose transport system permease protein